MRVLLLTPPLVQPNAPYPATPVLTAYLRSRGIAAAQADLSLALLLRLFSRRGVRMLARELERRPPRRGAAAARFFRAHAAAYERTVEPVVAFLQGRAPELAARIAGRRWLPEGPRFAVLAELPAEAAPEDEQTAARHLASLYLDDLADAVREGLDERFGLARYAERLAAATPDFAPLAAALEGPPTAVDREIEALARAAVRRARPDLVAVTAPFPGCVYGAFRVARAVKAERPGCLTVLGGGYPSTELRELADARVFRYFDRVVLDDGCAPLRRLARGGRPARTFECRGGRVRYRGDAAARPPRHGRMPAPVYDGLPLPRYLALRETTNPMLALWSDGRWNKLMLAHGCYWRRCAFCDTSLDYIRRFDPAPAATALAWMDRVYAETGYAGFHFVDEAAPPALLARLSELLIAGRRPYRWWGNIRFEPAFTPALARRMAQAGCVAVSGALETASPRTLALMRKGITLAGAERAMRALAQAGILVHAYLMYGFPTQTRAETVAALETVRRLFAAGALHSAYWHRFALTAHSPMGRAPERFGLRLLPAPAGGFARNELPYAEPGGDALERLGAALRRATYNYMHGIGLHEDARVWFRDV